MNTRNILGGWICFLGGFFVLYQFLIQGSTSLMVPQLVSDLHINMTQVGLLSSAFFYPYILLQIPSGALVDKFGPKLTLFAAGILLSLSTLAFSFSDSFISADLTRFMMGVASAPGVACAMYLAAQWFPKRFTIVAGIIEMLGMFGGALGDYFINYGVINFGWRTTMLYCALLGFAMSALILLSVQKNKSNILNHTHDGQAPQTWHYFKQMLKNIEIWKACFLGGFIFSIISAFASLWCIPFLSHLYPKHINDAAHATALVFVGAGLGALLSGWLANIYRPRTVMRIFTMGGLAIFVIIAFVPVSFHTMYALLLLLGICAGVYVVPFGNVEKQTHPDAQGMAMGFTNMMIIGLGGPLFQPLIGWFLSLQRHADGSFTTFNYQLAMMPILIGLILAVVCAFALKRLDDVKTYHQ